MEIAKLTILVLCLIISAINLVLIIRNSRRSASRSAALVQYVDKTMSAMHEEILKDVNESVSGIKATVDDLSKGIIPDYEEAKRAADATNEFHKGIANILNYNEMEALQRMREAEASGGEVE